MKHLQDWLGDTFCCAAGQREREIRHQNIRHFLGAATKVTMECVQKYCLNKSVRHNKIIVKLRLGSGTQALSGSLRLSDSGSVTQAQ